MWSPRVPTCPTRPVQPPDTRCQHGDLHTLLLSGVREVVGFGVSQPGFEQQSHHFLGSDLG